MDIQKAFDIVDREVFGLLKFGIHGNIVYAVQSSYKCVSCAISINDYLMKWSPIRQVIKQDQGLSPIMFAICINELVD